MDTLARNSFVASVGGGASVDMAVTARSSIARGQELPKLIESCGGHMCVTAQKDGTHGGGYTIRTRSAMGDLQATLYIAWDVGADC